MDLDVLFWVVIAGIVLAWLVHSIPEPAETLGGIFGFREVLWPSGVQEDDDAHWSWKRPARDRSARERAAPPEVVDGVGFVAEAKAPEAEGDRPEPEARPGVRGGTYQVRAIVRYEVRSADRARS